MREEKPMHDQTGLKEKFKERDSFNNFVASNNQNSLAIIDVQNSHNNLLTDNIFEVNIAEIKNSILELEKNLQTENIKNKIKSLENNYSYIMNNITKQVKVINLANNGKKMAMELKSLIAKEDSDGNITALLEDNFQNIIILYDDRFLPKTAEKNENNSSPSVKSSDFWKPSPERGQQIIAENETKKTFESKQASKEASSQGVIKNKVEDKMTIDQFQGGIKPEDFQAGQNRK